MAVPEVPTSRSRRALNGLPIFNTGMLALKTFDPVVQELIRHWQRFTLRASAAIADHKELMHLQEVDLGPFNVSEDDVPSLVVNDQLGLALQLTLTHASVHVRDLRRVALPPRFNFRGKGHGSVSDVVVNHDSKRKETDIKAHRDQVLKSQRGRGGASGGATRSLIFAGGRLLHLHRNQVERTGLSRVVRRRASATA
mmetsp:Transcript_49565/g.130359  ORF Transcript_49565/g.130359 Transcript_49565/m.130359 type:complete len:197 (+) Transcript_49565:3-593(+)